MASFIISSAAIAAMSRATSSQTSSVIASNGLKLSNSALTQAHGSMIKPFTGLKSNSAFPMSRKVNSITSLTSNGGRAVCLEIVFPLSALTFAKPGQWLGNTDNAPEFVGTDDLTNWGEIDLSKLQIGMTYSVLYRVTMDKNQTVDPVTSQVKLALDLPNGITKQTSMPLTVEPVNITEVLVGTFTNRYRVGTITFKFSSDDADKWKGLIIKSVVIRH